MFGDEAFAQKPAMPSSGDSDSWTNVLNKDLVDQIDGRPSSTGMTGGNLYDGAAHTRAMFGNGFGDTMMGYRADDPLQTDWGTSAPRPQSSSASVPVSRGLPQVPSATGSTGLTQEQLNQLQHLQELQLQHQMQLQRQQLQQQQQQLQGQVRSDQGQNMGLFQGGRDAWTRGGTADVQGDNHWTNMNDRGATMMQNDVTQISNMLGGTNLGSIGLDQGFVQGLGLSGAGGFSRQMGASFGSKDSVGDPSWGARNTSFGGTLVGGSPNSPVDRYAGGQIAGSLGSGGGSFTASHPSASPGKWGPLVNARQSGEPASWESNAQSWTSNSTMGTLHGDELQRAQIQVQQQQFLIQQQQLQMQQQQAQLSMLQQHQSLIGGTGGRKVHPGNMPGGVPQLTPNMFPSGAGNLEMYNLGGPSKGEGKSENATLTRVLFVRNVDNAVPIQEFIEAFSRYGEIRGFHSDSMQRGFLVVQYYDIRHSVAALKALNSELFGRRRIEIHCTLPKHNPNDNHGSLVVFNINPTVSDEDIVMHFSAAGEVREVRKAPNKNNHRFIEFFDIRCAQKALDLFNKTQFMGSIVKIELSRPVGVRRATHGTRGLDGSAGAMTGLPNSILGAMGETTDHLADTKSALNNRMLQIPDLDEETIRKMSQSIGDGDIAGELGLHQNNDNSQFRLKPDMIKSGEDKRTTLMIKNIPNKYNPKMLLHGIDARFDDKYDFFYLPMDFKNKCNMGYAFINFVDPLDILDFFNQFHGKTWDRFNSVKVCEITYGRLQGQVALINHFKNSNLLCQKDENYRPIILHNNKKVSLDASYTFDNPADEGRIDGGPAPPASSAVSQQPQQDNLLKIQELQQQLEMQQKALQQTQQAQALLLQRELQLAAEASRAETAATGNAQDNIEKAPSSSGNNPEPSAETTDEQSAAAATTSTQG